MKLLILVILLASPAVEVVAQDQSGTCATNRNAPPAGAYYWPPDLNVKIYFERGKFTPEQRTSLLDAMEQWSDTAGETGAGITFSYAGDIDVLATCNGCLTVTRREVHKHNRKVYALFSPGGRDSLGRLVSARIDLDFATTKPRALRAMMTHELGHGMGLWDCIKCNKKKTIMNSFSGINSDDRLIVPSPCDLEVVRQVYERERRVDTNVAARKE